INEQLGAGAGRRAVEKAAGDGLGEGVPVGLVNEYAVAQAFALGAVGSGSEIERAEPIGAKGGAVAVENNDVLEVDGGNIAQGAMGAGDMGRMGQYVWGMPGDQDGVLVGGAEGAGVRAGIRGEVLAVFEVGGQGHGVEIDVRADGGFDVGAISDK